MEIGSEQHEAARQKALAAARLTAHCLEWDLPHAAMVLARTAAHASLLALAAKPHGLADPDIRTLMELASSPRRRPYVGSDTQTAQACAMLAAVARLLGPPPQAIAAPQPPCWVEQGSFPEGAAVRNRTDDRLSPC